MNRAMRSALYATLAVAGAMLPGLGLSQTNAPAAEDASPPLALVSTIEGAIGPATARQISMAIETAEERRAKIINAEGEQQAAEKLVEAGRILGGDPRAMQLRYFAALHDIAGDKSNTIVFPMPLDLIEGLKASTKV